MSETRPPITAGPIERAFKFLKSTSVSWGAAGEGVGVAEGDESAVAADDAIGDALVIGAGVSCAGKIEIAQVERSKAQKAEDRAIIRSRL